MLEVIGLAAVLFMLGAAINAMFNLDGSYPFGTGEEDDDSVN